MNHHQDADPASRADADRLHAYGDALAAGTAPPSSDDLEATLLRLHAATGAPALDPNETSLSAGRKAAIWEDIMQQISLTPTPAVARPSLPRTSRWRAPLPPASAPSRRREWSATASLSVMLALAIGLIGVFVALRFEGAPVPPPENAGLFAAPTAPSLPASCVPNGDVPKNEDDASMSLSDWPAPEYAPVERVSYEQGLVIQQAYLMYQRCLADAFPDNGTPPSLPLAYPPDLLSYFSDRQRFILQASQETDRPQADMREYACRPVADNVLASFPLPVNQPQQAAIYSGSTGIQYAVYVFSPADVYRLPDGRYGAIIGTVSTASLQHPDELAARDTLTFVAFVEKGGRYYLDEEVLVLAPDTRRPIVDPPATDTPRTEITYHRLVDPACADLATPEAASTPAS
ncbi:MAG: hypothetical protein QM753_16435 [Thermomicrobiales bacterium]